MNVYLLWIGEYNTYSYDGMKERLEGIFYTKESAEARLEELRANLDSNEQKASYISKEKIKGES